MKNIDLIIFSKNRPLQLECLLRSIKENTDIFKKIYIQYSCDSEFKISYDKLINENISCIFINEKNEGFQKTFIKTFNLASDRVCFMVDDDILFEKVDKIPDCEIFSLRLGNNITYKSEFEYPGSLDGNIFYKKMLLQLIEKDFLTPNNLEHLVLQIVKGVKMEYFEKSKLIGIPNNKVSVNSKCGHMGSDVNTLNKLFLEGKRIDYKKMNLNHNGVHKYIDYIYY